MHLKQRIVLFLSLIFFIGCANVRQPGGGPIDTNPPELVTTIPPKNTINFTGNQVIMVFNEPIVENNLSQNLFITPKPKDDYTTVTRKNRLLINFQGELEENTTYTIFLKEALKDVTEGNAIKREVYTFSTGSIIDSLSISGNIRMLETNKPAKDIVVGLYKQNDETIPEKEKPEYFSITDENGSFLIPNLKEATYDIYAFEDGNKNFQYDPEQEKIGFKKNVDLNATIKGLNISIARFDDIPPKLVSQKSDSLTHTIQFSEGITNAKVESLNTGKFQYALNDSRKLTIYRPENYQDTVSAQIMVADSAGNLLTDTIQVYFSRNNLFYSANTNVIQEIIPTSKKVNPATDSIGLIFSAPIKKSTSESVELWTGKTKTKPDLSWNEYSNILYINTLPNFRDSLTLIIPEAAFIDVFNRRNKTDTVLFQKKTTESTGLISGTLSKGNGLYVLELLNESYKVVERKQNPQEFAFNYLDPGTYYLRVFEDTNNNGIWDKGNPRTNEEPEKVIFYPDEIKLRANWELTGISVDVE